MGLVDMSLYSQFVTEMLMMHGTMTAEEFAASWETWFPASRSSMRGYCGTPGFRFPALITTSFPPTTRGTKGHRRTGNEGLPVWAY
jgi:hypothetical protein